MSFPSGPNGPSSWPGTNPSDSNGFAAPSPSPSPSDVFSSGGYGSPEAPYSSSGVYDAPSAYDPSGAGYTQTQSMIPPANGLAPSPTSMIPPATGRNTSSAFFPEESTAFSSGTDVSRVSAPTFLLWIALALVVVSVLLALFLPFLWVEIIAWGLCSFGALGLVFAHSILDAKRQMSVFYVISTLDRVLYRIVVLCALLGIVVPAVQIALLVGRL